MRSRSIRADVFGAMDVPRPLSVPPFPASGVVESDSEQERRNKRRQMEMAAVHTLRALRFMYLFADGALRKTGRPGGPEP